MRIIDKKIYRLSEIEKKIISLITTNRYRILAFILAFGMLNLLPALPYLNLFISRSLIIFLIFLFFVVIFNLDTKIILFILFSFLLLSLGLYLIGDAEAAELLGNYIYGFLFAGTILYIMQ